MKLSTRLLCLFLAICSMFALAGCHKKGETVMTVGDIAISSGMYVAFQLEGFQVLKSGIDAQYTEAGTVSPITAYEDYLEQTYEGTDAKTYINNHAQNLALEYAWIQTQFKNSGLEYSADEMAFIDAYAQQEWEGLKALYEPSGVSYETFKDYYLTFLDVQIPVSDTNTQTYNTSMKAKLFYYYYDKKNEETGLGGVEAVADETLIAELGKTVVLADVMDVALSSTDATTGETTEMTEEETKKVKSDLTALAKRINKGESFADIYKEYKGEEITEQTFETTIEAETIYPKTAFAVSSTVTAFTLFDEKRQEEDFKYEKAYVLDDSASGYYYLAVIYDITKDPYYLEYYRASLLQSLMLETYEAKIDAGAKAMAVVKDEKLLKHYQPSKFDFSDLEFQAS